MNIYVERKEPAPPPISKVVFELTPLEAGMFRDFLGSLTMNQTVNMEAERYVEIDNAVLDPMYVELNRLRGQGVV